MLDTLILEAGVTYATENTQQSNTGTSIHPGTSYGNVLIDMYGNVLIDMYVLFLCTEKMPLAAAINYFFIL